MSIRVRNPRKRLIKSWLGDSIARGIAQQREMGRYGSMQIQ
jgi:hypothetical protein